MGSGSAIDSPDAPDPEVLRGWLADSLGRRVERVAVERFPAGYANGAWRLDVETAGTVQRMVLKAPRVPSVVYQLDQCREARLMATLGRVGAPLPAVLAIDEGTRAVGRPCFVMECVEGRSVPDGPGGVHVDGWFRAAGPRAQRAIWDSFHDALATLHAADPAVVADVYDGPVGAVEFLHYWRAALLDVVDAHVAPRHIAVFDWLRANIPSSADAPLALCMGDARLVNGIVSDGEVRALVDFEVAYVGNPMADVGYSLFVDRSQRAGTESPVPGIPPDDDTWSRWSVKTGRALTDVDYWSAFGATIIVVTATRAMVQWGLVDPFAEEFNGMLPAWESMVERAAR